MIPEIRIRRAYEKPLEKDGCRVLVDRVWPRGVSRQEAALSEWAKALAPSQALRKWWNHDPVIWAEFCERYVAELQQNDAVPDFVSRYADKKVITLIYGAKDTEHNQAIVLRQYLTAQFLDKKPY